MPSWFCSLLSYRSINKFPMTESFHDLMRVQCINPVVPTSICFTFDVSQKRTSDRRNSTTRSLLNSNTQNAWTERTAATREPCAFEMSCTGSHRKSLFFQNHIHNLPTPNTASAAIPNTTTSVSVLLIITLITNF